MREETATRLSKRKSHNRQKVAINEYTDDNEEAEEQEPEVIDDPEEVRERDSEEEVSSTVTNLDS